MNYCIYGTETILMNDKINQIIKEWVNDESDMSVQRYDAAESGFSISNVIDDCWIIPFFSTYKVILVRNCNFLSTSDSLSETDQTILTQYLEKSNSSTILILAGEFEKLDSRKKISKLITKSCECSQFNQLDKAQFSAIVRQKCQHNNIRLSPKVMDELLLRLTPDLMNFKNVLNKLILYPYELNEEAIRLLVTRPLEDNVFELVNAVVQCDLKKAMHHWRDLQILNTDPIGLISLISNQFRLLYQVKVLHEQGVREASMANMLKIHPYRIKLAHESSYKISLERMSSLIQECAQLDQDFKFKTMDRVFAFERFLILATKGV